MEAYVRMDEEGFDLKARPRPKLVSDELRAKMLEKKLVPPPDDVVEDIKDEIAAKRKRVRPDEMLAENDADLRKIEAQIRKHPYLGQAIPMQRPDFVRLTRADPDYLKVWRGKIFFLFIFFCFGTAKIFFFLFFFVLARQKFFSFYFFFVLARQKISFVSLTH